MLKILIQWPVRIRANFPKLSCATWRRHKGVQDMIEPLCVDKVNQLRKDTTISLDRLACGLEVSYDLSYAYRGILRLADEVERLQSLLDARPTAHAILGVV